ncbi:unnamed protein product [Ceratitis capitata]|uniref:Regulatory protein zeste n=1 Tax=Ceratitis capitata TaxID=7213 RepID=W8BFQ7_CERCA|nr:unnamed protein product [Ceratitis capitata]
MEARTPKTTTTEQFQLMARAIQKFPDLARRLPCFGSARVLKNEKWKEITKKLNDIGPPERSPQEWKKVLCDLKLRTKKKIAENISAGYEVNILSESERALGKVLNVVETVKPKGETFGVPLVKAFPTVTVRTLPLTPPPLDDSSPSSSTRAASPAAEIPSVSHKRKADQQPSDYLLRRQLLHQIKYMKIAKSMVEVLDKQSLCLERLSASAEKQEMLMERQLELIEKQTIAMVRQANALEKMAEI